MPQPPDGTAVNLLAAVALKTGEPERELAGDDG
jgi:hypothetical protein